MKRWPNTRKRSHWIRTHYCKHYSAVSTQRQGGKTKRWPCLTGCDRSPRNVTYRRTISLLSISDLAKRTKQSISSNKPTRIGMDTTSGSSKSIRSSIRCAGIHGLKRWFKKYLLTRNEFDNCSVNRKTSASQSRIRVFPAILTPFFERITLRERKAKPDAPGGRTAGDACLVAVTGCHPAFRNFQYKMHRPLTQSQANQSPQIA
jgi:hypothetical protein